MHTTHHQCTSMATTPPFRRNQTREVNRTVQYKDFQTTTKTVDAAQGLVECLFSVTRNVDREGDVIDSGAFANVLAKKKSVPVVFSHKWEDIGQVLGRTKAWAEWSPGDARLPADLYAQGSGGVWAQIQFNLNVAAGKTAFELVKSGDLTEWSFAFQSKVLYDTKGIRHHTEITEIYEVTLCPVGANQATRVLAAKNTAASIRSATLGAGRADPITAAVIQRVLRHVLANETATAPDYSDFMRPGHEGLRLD